MVIVAAHFTMRPGKTAGALRLIAAVKRQAERDQPGTLVYLVHRVLDNGKPGRTLFFYEQYRSQKALLAHLNSTSWQAVVKNWSTYFEGKSAKVAIKFWSLKRVAAFERPGAVPAAR